MALMEASESGRHKKVIDLILLCHGDASMCSTSIPLVLSGYHIQLTCRFTVLGNVRLTSARDISSSQLPAILNRSSVSMPDQCKRLSCQTVHFTGVISRDRDSHSEAAAAARS